MHGRYLITILLLAGLVVQRSLGLNYTCGSKRSFRINEVLRNHVASHLASPGPLDVEEAFKKDDTAVGLFIDVYCRTRGICEKCTSELLSIDPCKDALEARIAGEDCKVAWNGNRDEMEPIQGAGCVRLEEIRRGRIFA